MSSITPDIEQWLLMDEKVVRKWRSLAWRLGLSDCIIDIDCYRGGSVSGMSRRRRGSREKDKLELLIKIWKENRPETFNGLSDMWMWINIITNKSEGQPGQSLQSPSIPAKTGSTPWSKYLYSDQSSYSQSSYAESDYSLPHSPTSSRPSSQVSFYTSSCPTTPLSSRRMSQSPYRTSQTARASPGSGKSGVFETLYRPDLIRLSDPRRGQRRHSETEESVSVRISPPSRNTNHFSRQSPANHLQDSQQRNNNRKISDECDQLLRELECDMTNMNNNIIKRGETKTHANTAKKVSNYNKQVFYINKVKMVELSDVKFSNDSVVQEKKVDISTLNNNKSTNNQDYFDSLIKLIENAAKNLSE